MKIVIIKEILMISDIFFFKQIEYVNLKHSKIEKDMGDNCSSCTVATEN